MSLRTRGLQTLLHVIVATVALGVVYASTPAFRWPPKTTTSVGARPPAIPPAKTVHVRHSTTRADAVTVPCPSTLYIVESGNLYTLDPLTGASTFVSAIASAFPVSGLRFAPDGTLYGNQSRPSGSRWLRVDVDTGASTDAGPAFDVEQRPGGAVYWFPPDYLPEGSATLGIQMDQKYGLGPGSFAHRSGSLRTLHSLEPYSFALDIPYELPRTISNPIGNAISRDGLTSWFVTTDTIYSLDLTESPAKALAYMSLGSLELSPDTVVSEIDDDGHLYIVDGVWLYNVDLAAKMVSSRKLNAPLSFVTDVTIRRCPAGGVRISPTRGLETTERGTTATFDAVLTTQPSADVAFGISSSDSSEGTVAPSSLTFTSGNWNVPRTVTITGVRDFVIDATKSYSIVNSRTSSIDPNYDDRFVASVRVSNEDVDGASIDVAPPSVTVTAGGPDAAVTLSLGTRPASHVTVPLSVTGGAALLSGPDVTFTRADWSPRQVLVSAPLGTAGGSFTVVTGSATSSDAVYHAIDAADVSGTIVPSADPFTFADQTAVPLSTVITSNSITVSGIDSPKSISITGGQYELNASGAWSSVAGTVNDGDTVRVRHASSAAFSTATNTRLAVGFRSDTFSTTTIAKPPNASCTARLLVKESGSLFTVDLAAGTSTFVSRIDAAYDVEGLQFAPDGTLYGYRSQGFPDPGRRLRVDVDTGAVTDVGPGSDTTYSNGLTYNWFPPNYLPEGSALLGIQMDQKLLSPGTFHSSGSLRTIRSVDPYTFALDLPYRLPLAFNIPIGNAVSRDGLTSYFVTIDTVYSLDLTRSPATAVLHVPLGVFEISPDAVVSDTDDNGHLYIADGVLIYDVDTVAKTVAVKKIGGLSFITAVMVQRCPSGGVRISPTQGLATGESGTTATFEAILTTQPSADVTFAVSSSDPAEGTVAPASLTFTAANWKVPQTVTVTGAHDFAIDGPKSYSVVNSRTSSADPNYSNRFVSGVLIVNADIDVAGIAATPDTISVTAGGPATPVTLSLSSRPASDVTIPLSVTGGGALLSAPSVTFTNADWSPRQVLVSAPLGTAGGPFTVLTGSAISSDTDYTSIDANDVAGTIVASANPFAFIDQTDVALSTLTMSNAITVSGIDSAKPISVTGGEYELNASGTWASSDGAVNSGDTVRVRHTSNAAFSTTTNTTLAIGVVSDTFSTTTIPADTTPDPFAFVAQTNVALSTLTVSNAITVSGINTAAPVFVTGGEYEINASGAWVTSAGTADDGDTVRVRHTSSAAPATVTATTLTIGGVAATFSTTTVPADTTPGPFAFVAQTDVPLSSVRTSNAITVSGINTGTPVSVAGGEYELNASGTWTTSAGAVIEGSSVRVRHTSSAAFSTTTSTTLDIGGLSATFSSTTLAPVSTPDPFAFIDQTNVPLSALATSNAITVSGINTAASVSVTAGEYELNASGVWVTSAGTVVEGNTVRVRHTSSAAFSTSTDTTLVIGGRSDTFSSTTLAAITSPAPFAFVDQTNVQRSTLAVSNAITISGIDAAAPVSVTGGEYEINASGTWVSSAGTVNNTDTVRVRHTSSAAFSTATNTTLDAGGVTDTFSTTTLTAPDVVNGVCGTAAGIPTPFVPRVNLCAQGTAGPVGAASPWAWQCLGTDVGATSATCSAPNQTLPTGGLGRATVAGGSWIAGTASAGFIPLTGHALSPPARPADARFVAGLFAFVLEGGTPGTTATVTITYPQPLPAGAVYFKYGPTAADPSPHWYVFPSAVISGDTVTLTITDGGAGDDDLTANGTIVDAGGAATIQAAAAAIPSLSEWMQLLLCGMLLLGGLLALRAQP